MAQPKGFIPLGADDKVCLLRKSLYSLKQLPRQWYKRFDMSIMKNSFWRSNFGSCVYFKLFSNDVQLYLLLYVDDILIAYKEKAEIVRRKALLVSEFEMKDMGGAKKILGMDVIYNRSNGTLVLSRYDYF